MKTKQQASQPQARCIFCNSLGLTKEHLWPNWMGSYLPQVANANIQVKSYLQIGRGKTVFGLPITMYNRQGHAGSRKLKIVCKACNNEWMSELVNESKPIIMRLVSTPQSKMTASDYSVLASWIALSTVVAEYTDVETKAATAQDRAWLKSNQIPPNSWYIWIGRHEGNSKKWNQNYEHFGALIAKKGRDITDRACNFQTSCFGLHGLVFFVASTSFDDAQYEIDNYINPKLLRIHPHGQTEVDLSQVDGLSDDEVNAISSSMHEVIYRMSDRLASHNQS